MGPRRRLACYGAPRLTNEFTLIALCYRDSLVRGRMWTRAGHRKIITSRHKRGNQPVAVLCTASPTRQDHEVGLGASACGTGFRERSLMEDDYPPVTRQECRQGAEEVRHSSAIVQQAQSAVWPAQ
jgi:hypothetical protein